MKKDSLPHGIFRRKPGGSLHIRWKDELGRDCKMSTGGKEITVAKALLAKKKEEVRMRRLGLALGKREEERVKLTVGDLLERYRPYYESKDNPTPYLGYIKRWNRSFGRKLAAQVVPGDIEQWRRDMQALGMKNATVNRHTAFLKAVYNLGIRDQLVDANPLAKGRLRKLEESGPRDRVISRSEETLILPKLEPVDRAAFIVSLYSGMRQAELLNLRRDDVQFDTDRLRLNKTKAKRAQYVPMNSALREALTWVMCQHGHDLLFPSQDDPGRPMSGSRLTERLKAVCEELGLRPGILWHTTRHTYATRLGELGTATHDVKELARHSSIQVTERYMHANEKQTRDASERLVQEYAGDSPLFPASPAHRGHLRAL